MISRRDLLKSALTAAAATMTVPLYCSLRSGTGHAWTRALAAVQANPAIDVPWAVALVEFCVAAYVQFDTPSKFAVPSAYRFVSTFTGQDQQQITAPYGFIAESPAAVVIAFRGTQTTTEWITDADVSFTRFPFVPGAGYTHAGFTGIYASMRAQILTALRRVPTGRPLYITGHSLGAALATLHALDAAINLRFPSLLMYNFASPRVGDRRFAGRYDEAVKTGIRFVNTADIVTTLPSTATGYAHVKRPWNFTTDTGTRAGNHALTTYAAAVKKA